MAEVLVSKPIDLRALTYELGVTPAPAFRLTKDKIKSPDVDQAALEAAVSAHVAPFEVTWPGTVDGDIEEKRNIWVVDTPAVDGVYDEDGNEITAPVAEVGHYEMVVTTRPLTADEQAQLQARLDADAAEADRNARIQALAAKSVTDLEASAAAIEARADFYAAAADATSGTAVTYINIMVDDVEGLARRVADLQETVAHLIRLTVLD
jgi:hypothetical protein